MKSNISEILTGFFWGIGFSIAIALCTSAYLISALPKIDEIYKEVISNRLTHSLKQVANDYDINVIDIYKSERLLKVTVSVKNLTNEEVYGKGIRVKLFSKSNRFIGSCNSARNQLFIKPKGISYHEVSCQLFPTQITKITTAKASLNLI